MGIYNQYVIKVMIDSKCSASDVLCFMIIQLILYNVHPIPIDIKGTHQLYAKRSLNRYIMMTKRLKHYRKKHM